MSISSKLKQHLFAPNIIKQKQETIEVQNKTILQLEHELNVQMASIKEANLKFEQFAAQTHRYLSYAQAGEDRIVNFLFDDLGLPRPSYLDVGANDPFHISNTYFFYLKGSYGVCVEPDPELFEDFKKSRPRDICLNMGVGQADSQPIPFYVFEKEARGLNTFLKEEAALVEKAGLYKIEKILQIPIKNINDIIAEYFESHPNFLSLDVEGLDISILKSLDFNRFPIDVVCAETITYADGGFRKKIPEIATIMQSRGYRIYADTHINTIFVNENAFERTHSV